VHERKDGVRRIISGYGTQEKTRSRREELYRVGNWSEYDRALVPRGSYTVWIADGFEKAWFYQSPLQRGSQFDYSAQAIEIVLTLKNVFHLPNRATEGFAHSLFGLLEIGLPVPGHMTLSRRGKTLKVSMPKRADGHLDLVMDNTGLKIYGEGEWKVGTHGKSKRRIWRKLHLSVDRHSGEIQAAELTEAGVSDDAMAEMMLAQIERPIDSLAADGSYDKRRVYKSLNQYAPSARVLIPPRRNARIWQHANSNAERLKRDENLRYIRKYGRVV
jgi:Transposase DDE domain